MKKKTAIIKFANDLLNRNTNPEIAIPRGSKSWRASYRFDSPIFWRNDVLEVLKKHGISEKELTNSPIS